jgi:tetratricopeptide (TPR) repeat protein
MPPHVRSIETRQLRQALERALPAVVLALFMSVAPASAQDFLSRARELYATADFEEALKVLDEAGVETVTPDQRQSAREYRALCLLALDRTEEMEKTIEQMIDADPFYRPAAERTSHRFLVVFGTVRRRLLLSKVRERYAKAKEDLEEQRESEATAGFELVLRLVKDAGDESEHDGGPDDRTLADFGTLAAQLLDANRVARERNAIAPEKAVYRNTDPQVIPPVPIRQDIPPWQSIDVDGDRFDGELELLIDTQGDVQQAWITVPIHPAYDQVILQAAAKWKYRPATKYGRPVVYYKAVTISLVPQRSLGGGSARP